MESNAVEKFDDKRRKAKWFKVAATVFPLVIALGFFIFLIAFIENAKGNLDSTQKLADQEFSRYDELKRNNDLLEAKIKKLNDTLQDSQNKSCQEQKEATKEALAQVSSIPGIDLTKPSPTQIPKVPTESKGNSLVYIQIVDESQREKAKTIAEMLRSKGYNVPGIELVKSLKGKVEQTQVRYFHQDEVVDARKLASLLKVGDLKLIFTPLPAPKGQMEIWFADN